MTRLLARKRERERYILQVSRYFHDSDTYYTPDDLAHMCIPRLDMLIEELSDINKKRIEKDKKDMEERDKKMKKTQTRR